jgi:hypothetical protein
MGSSPDDIRLEAAVQIPPERLSGIRPKQKGGERHPPKASESHSPPQIVYSESRCVSSAYIWDDRAAVHFPLDLPRGALLYMETSDLL